MIRVLLADDHAMVRKGLRQLLGGAADIEVSAEATNGAEVLQQLETVPVDVLLLDISMPGRSGLEVIGDVRQAYPGVPILILSTHSEDQLAAYTMEAGASGYVSKECAPEQLLEAVRRVHAGDKYISPALAVLLAELNKKP